MEAGVRKLSLGLKTGYREHSIATVACLPGRRLKERCLPYAGLADHHHRGTMLRRSRQGSLELSKLGVPPDQRPCHATKIREPRV